MNPVPPIFDNDVHGRPQVPRGGGALRDRFTYPPFTVFNAREGEWQDRKRAWIRLGIRSELGRGANALGHSVESGNRDFYRDKADVEAELGRILTKEEAVAELRARGLLGLDSGAGRDGNLLGLSPQAEDYRRREGAYARDPDAERVRREKAATPGGGGGPNSRYFKTGGKKADAKAFNLGMGASAENGWAQDDDHGSGTSIFDPVLCELLYTWYAPLGGQVVDPFAGGSVRGIVAGCLGRRYWGCDLSAAQVAANRAQVGLVPAGMPRPEWRVGDAAVEVAGAPAADFIIACPPYFDLEVYSDDPRDLSRMDWEGFRAGYAGIIADAAARLRPDRFAAFVGGDVRDERGVYRNLPGYTTACFRAAGMELYNEAVLVTAVGSLSIRTERQFVVSRKQDKTHQNVLVYVKGDPVRATDAATGLSLAARRDELE